MTKRTLIVWLSALGAVLIVAAIVGGIAAANHRTDLEDRQHDLYCGQVGC